MTAGKMLRVLLLVLILLGTISSLTLYYLTYHFQPKIPLRARQVMIWPEGGDMREYA